MAQTDHRIASLDITRGLIVAIMALDHVRIFFAEAQFDPVDLSQTTPGYFFTRLVTHVCAPGFFFIAGLGAALAEARNPSKKRALAGFLASRGVWLMALELTVMGIAWSFGLGWFWFGVLWALGAAMLLLSALIFVPRVLLLVAAVGCTLFSQPLLGLIAAGPDSVLTPLVTGGVWQTPLLGPRIVLYPVLPWLCLMSIGYAAAPHLMHDGRLRGGAIAGLGALMVAAFVAARMAGFGGGAPEADGLLAFLNVEKYPPSLQFSLLTLGPLLMLLGAVSWAEQRRTPLALFHPLRIYGRVPFFFYIIHIYLIHGVALVCARLLHWPTDYLFWSGLGPNLTPPDGYGFGLTGIYIVWVVVLVVLYALCRWFADVKSAHPAWQLKYL